MKAFEWHCHQCGRVDRGFWLWLARRRSIRHERSAHGRSVYDK